MSRSVIESTNPLRPVVLMEALSRVFPRKDNEVHIPVEWSRAFRAAYAYMQMHDRLTGRKPMTSMWIGSYSPEYESYRRSILPKVPVDSTVRWTFSLKELARAAWNGGTLEGRGIKFIFPPVSEDDEVRLSARSTNWKRFARANWSTAQRLVQTAKGATNSRPSSLSYVETIG